MTVLPKARPAGHMRLAKRFLAVRYQVPLEMTSSTSDGIRNV